jgi:hypothetical protein
MSWFPSRRRASTSPLCPALPSRNALRKLWFKLAGTPSQTDAAIQLRRERRQPLAAALGQKGLLGRALLEKPLLEKRLRGEVSRTVQLAADNGLQIAVIMPHLHRSQIRWSSVSFVVQRDYETRTCIFE